MALLNPETSVFVQKRHLYTGTLNREMSGNSKNVFGDVLVAEALIMSSDHLSCTIGTL